jgi:hypothetical protein
VAGQAQALIWRSSLSKTIAFAAFKVWVSGAIKRETQALKAVIAIKNVKNLPHV